MARKTNKLPLGENGRLQLHLNASKLETLKNISPSAFACAVYGASINRDTQSLWEVARYLVGANEGALNATMADGKSLMDREYPVNAFGLSDAGKVTELKDKDYIFAMLFSPLAHCTREEFSKDKGLQDYAELLAGMPKMLKLGGSPVAAAVYKMGMSPLVDVPLQEVVKPLTDGMSDAQPLLGAITRIYHELYSGKPGSPPKTLRQEHQKELLRVALESDAFCKGLVTFLDKASRAAGGFYPWQFAILNGLPGTAWPTHPEMRRFMEHLTAIKAIRIVASAYDDLGTLAAQAKNDLKELRFPDLQDPNSGDTVSATTFLQQYGQINGPVQDGVALTVRQDFFFRNLEKLTEVWSLLEPVQQRISRDGGLSIWPKVFTSNSSQHGEFMMDVIHKYAANDPEGAVHALLLCSSLGYAKKGVIRHPRMVAALIAAGADIRSHGRKNDTSFAEFIAQSPRNGNLRDHPEILAAIQAQEARAALKGVDAMAEVDQTVPRIKRAATR